MTQVCAIDLKVLNTAPAKLKLESKKKFVWIDTLSPAGVAVESSSPFPES